MTKRVALRMSQDLFACLMDHLFPGDHDEYGAVILAGLAETDEGTRLLAREVVPAIDGKDYVPGTYGYRALSASFVTRQILRARDERLCYLAVHNHLTQGRAAFSSTDLDSHSRGYPALRDVGRGIVVGALVFGVGAVAGDLWLPDGSRAELASLDVVGAPIRRLRPTAEAFGPAERRFDRQARLFGADGQAVLRELKVGIVGAGGVGMLLVEYLARLGVGRLVIADPDRVDETNLSRLVGARRADAAVWFTSGRWPRWLRAFGARRATLKVDLAARVARAANPSISVERYAADFRDDAVARRFVDCDFVFLAADGMGVRLVFNSLVHQYLVPGAQVGAKVRVDPTSGSVEDIFSVARPVWPDHGCLWCSGLISPARLAEEPLTVEQRRAQRYVEEASVVAPSVITLNASAASRAADDFLMMFTGLVRPDAHRDFVRFQPQRRETWLDPPRRDEMCSECGRGDRSRFARGDARRLPTRG